MQPFIKFGGFNESLLVKLIPVTIILSLVFNYLLKYPQLPKIYAYQAVKQVIKLKLQYQPAGWSQLESEQVELYYKEQDLATIQVVREVGQEAIQLVNEALDFKPAGPVPLMVYPDQEALNKSFGWDADVNAMGTYWGGVIKILSPRAWIYAWIGEESAPEDLAHTFKYYGPVVHEYVHLVVDKKTRGNYPRWFTEGVAQYWERELTGFQFDSPAGDLNQKLYPLKMMDRQFDNLPNQALAYSQSLAALDYFYQTYSQEKLEQLLTELARGRSFSQALFKAVGTDFSGFEQDFHRWLETLTDSPQEQLVS